MIIGTERIPFKVSTGQREVYRKTCAVNGLTSFFTLLAYDPASRMELYSIVHDDNPTAVHDERLSFPANTGREEAFRRGRVIFLTLDGYDIPSNRAIYIVKYPRPATKELAHVVA